MLKVLLIIPSSTSQKIHHYCSYVLFSYHYLLFPFCSLAQFKVSIQRHMDGFDMYFID